MFRLVMYVKYTEVSTLCNTFDCLFLDINTRLDGSGSQEKKIQRILASSLSWSTRWLKRKFRRWDCAIGVKQCMVNTMTGRKLCVSEHSPVWRAPKYFFNWRLFPNMVHFLKELLGNSGHSHACLCSCRSRWLFHENTSPLNSLYDI